MSSSREARIYQRFLIEEADRYSEDALAIPDDEMSEYIERMSKRKAAMVTERAAKRRKVESSPAQEDTPVASSSSSNAQQMSRTTTREATPSGSAPLPRRTASPEPAESRAPAIAPRSKSDGGRDLVAIGRASGSVDLSIDAGVEEVSGTAVRASPPPALRSKTATITRKDTLGIQRSALEPSGTTSSSAVGSSRAPVTVRAPAPNKRKADPVLPITETPGASSSKEQGMSSASGSSKRAKIDRKNTVVKPKPPTKSEIKKAEREAKKAREAEQKAREERERGMAHAEYIAYLPEKFAKRSRGTVLSGVVILYVHIEGFHRASEYSRRRYDMMWRLGADIVPKFDMDKVTHVIAEPITVPWSNIVRRAREMCSVKTMLDLPVHIKTLKWEWIARCQTSEQRPPPSSDASYEAFDERIVVVKPKRFGRPQEKSRRNEHDSSQESSDEETQAKPIDRAQGSSFVSAASKSPAKEDPLAEFYEQARFEAEDHVSEDESDEEKPAPVPAVGLNGKVLKGFQCDTVGGHLNVNAKCANEDIVTKFQELLRMHETGGMQNDHFRVISYRKIIAALRRHPTRIRTTEEALKIPGIANKTASKIMEIIETGDLQRLDTERKSGFQTIELFRGIFSVGSNIARKWYGLGLRTLDDVRERKAGIKLTAAQEIGLRYYEDLNQRMPRPEAGEIFGMIKQRALDIDPNLMLDIMGSYRRRKETCGDIDILITRNPSDGTTHSGIMRKLLRVLHDDGILTEDLSMPHDLSALETKYMGIGRRDATSPRRRIDILTIPFEQWGGALLYFTGDDIFNRSMRLKANKMGYSLNQRGLYRGVIRDPCDRTSKLDSGELFASRTEREIFDALGVPWQEPWERARG